MHSQRGIEVPTIRVLLGSLPENVRQTISQAISARPELELAGVFTSPLELLAAAGELRADVVVVAAVAGALPGIATHLVDQFPDIRVLAVTGGETALSFRLRPCLDLVRCTTADELAEVIRGEENGEEDPCRS
jgi:DNA-binding NarL/FixJ family response regulator